MCRVGRDFYLACSSFEYFPGVPIFHSRDLVHWRQLGHALTRRGQLDLAGCRSSGGVYAPTLRHHDDVFFLVTTLVGRGHLLVTARDPHGPWSDPQWLDEDGIDPSLAFLDGRIFYTRNGRGSDPDHPFVYQGELAAVGEGFRLARRPRVVWKGTGGVWPEAPHLYRRGQWYYLLTAEGGTSYGHSVVVARSRRGYGPFTPSPHGPLVASRVRHPFQALGHADLVELDDGSTWAVLLGIRPTRGHHHLGRETFLAPVHWGEDAWPRMPLPAPRMEGPALRRSAPADLPRRRGFAGTRLGTEWVFVRNPARGSWSLRERPGRLRLWGQPATLADVASPALVCRRQQHVDAVARTRLTFAPRHANEQAGICIRANEAFHVALVVAPGEARLVRTSRARSVTVGRMPWRGDDVTLEVRATAERYAFAVDGTHLGTVSTRLLSAETILAATGRHHFTGAMLGLYATGAGARSSVPADFHWFEYEPWSGAPEPAPA